VTNAAHFIVQPPDRGYERRDSIYKIAVDRNEPADSVPFVEPLDALGDSELRRTLMFVRAQPGSVTAADVAGGLEVPRTVARWRLERLLDAGLLVAGFERRTSRSGPGAGRPAKAYAVAAETAPIEFPRRRTETLLGLLVRALPRRRRAAKLKEVGAAFAQELARAAHVRPAATPKTALRRLCRGLGGLGFHASVESVSEDEALIVSATCPLRPFVMADPEACAIDEGMWRGLVEAAVDGRRPSRVAAHGCFDADEPCRILVTFRD
jgi:predicted ArsR family transcriptional regulator